MKIVNDLERVGDCCKNIAESALVLNLIEYGPTDKLFINPRRKATEDYITGRFG